MAFNFSGSGDGEMFGWTHLHVSAASCCLLECLLCAPVTAAQQRPERTALVTPVSTQLYGQYPFNVVILLVHRISSCIIAS